ncbi:LOW QUALITY PROTEIN: hypothetical protein PHMEG_0007446 [Phytophthora megakarya]|uniref:Ndc10 domain-containing protein n=1 Tax=Phytophthora megakarya TaxID=4795 RepID=A0A225WL70_9STRA|nr:LOW QUALITY PROTEIN: hypothetical protein PHMEG_0007446 [Phytophthora megakarya]
MTSRYKPELTRFKSFKDGIAYSSNYVFTIDEVLRITPDDLCRWMNQQAYGDPEPNELMKHFHRRLSTLEFAKKAISSSIPRVYTTCDPVTERGNPTRSDAMNKLTKKVKRFDVRRAKSKSRQAIEFSEFLNLLLLVRAQWKSDNSSYLIRWSKYIHEERDAPEQIIIGSMDPQMCVLLNLAVHIESTSSIVSSEFVYGNPKDGDLVVQRFLTNMVKNDAFKKLKAGKLGTHSLRKCATTYATRSGVSKDFVNQRGRWRTRQGVVDVYIDNTRPYPNAVTAATLAGPAGPCFYSLKAGVGCVYIAILVNQISPTIKQHVVERDQQNLRRCWSRLATPLQNYDYAVLLNKRQQRILRAFPNGIFVTGDESQLNLVVMENSESCEQDNCAAITRPGGNVGGGGVNRGEFAALHAQIAEVRLHTTDEVQQLRRDIQREMHKLQAIFRRAHRVVLLLQNIFLAANMYLQPDYQNDLRICTNYDMICGDLKAAKDFTAVERGANKLAYSRRKVFWDVVSSLVRSGFTSDTAIDKVYSVYGRQLSVSNILVALRADCKCGGHLGLRV